MFLNFSKTNYVQKNKLFLYNLQVRKCTNVIPSVVSSDTRTKKFSSLLTNYGFNPGQINRIFKSQHSILSLKQECLLSNLVNWLNFDVGDKLSAAICAHPELLTLNPDFVNSRAQELMTLFTKKDINKLLVTSPNVFLDEFTDIHDKVQYIAATMKVDQKSIVKSHALQFDLFHIKCRHNFMVRAGRYILHKKAMKNKNAPLHKIFSRNIETFLKLTNLTEEEYNVFCVCYEDEIDEDLYVDLEEHDE